MLDTGLFDREPVSAIFAGHMNPELPLGQIELIYGTAHAAADTLKIRIKGKGGHGAAPQLCIDPILAGAHLITQLQIFTSRNLAPLDSAVLSICEFHAGTAENIIPENAELVGTLRTLTPDVRTLAIIYGGPSILFKLAAVALMRRFPIDEAEHRRIREALAATGADGPLHLQQ